jgi:ribonuclease HI
MTLNEDRSLAFIEENKHKAKWILCFDGASNSSHGVSGVGVAIFKDGVLNDFISEKLPNVQSEDGTSGDDRIQTNNESEYQALISSLRYCLEHDITDVIIYGDSKLVVNQTNGSFKVNKSHLIPLQRKAVELAKSIRDRETKDISKPKILIKHVHRERNFFADVYSKICINQIKDRALAKFNAKYAIITK